MKYSEIKSKNTDELQKDLDTSRQEITELKVSNKMGQLKQIHKISGLRKTIAQIMTELNSRVQ